MLRRLAVWLGVVVLLVIGLNVGVLGYLYFSDTRILVCALGVDEQGRLVILAPGVMQQLLKGVLRF